MTCAQHLTILDPRSQIFLPMPRKGFPIPLAPERPEEFAPGLDPELQQLADALTEFKEKMVAPKKTSIPAKKSRKR